MSLKVFVECDAQNTQEKDLIPWKFSNTVTQVKANSCFYFLFLKFKVRMLVKTFPFIKCVATQFMGNDFGNVVFTVEY